MLKTSASFVLGSSKSSTYPRGYASGFDSPAALLNERFEHPAYSGRPRMRHITTGRCRETEFFRSLRVPVKRETLPVKHRGRQIRVAALVLLAAVLSQSWLQAFAKTNETKLTLTPPQDVRAFDTPSDGGGSLTVLWSPAPYDSAAIKYQILLSEGTAVA